MDCLHDGDNRLVFIKLTRKAHLADLLTLKLHSLVIPMTEHPHQLLQGTVLEHERADIPSDIRCDIHLIDHSLSTLRLQDCHITGFHHILSSTLWSNADTTVDQHNTGNADLIFRIDIELCAILFHITVGSMYDKRSVLILRHKEISFSSQFYLTCLTAEVYRIPQLKTLCLSNLQTFPHIFSGH